MANRNHSLDDGIIQAAYSEFLAYGFQKASLHKIAEKAGVTTGAIYTRYKNKDALFACLLQDFFETMQVLFAPVAEEYEKAKCSAQPEDILRAINAEEQVYFQLLTEHCNDCTLFFCRSDGSSMETVLHLVAELAGAALLVGRDAMRAQQKGIARGLLGGRDHGHALLGEAGDDARVVDEGAEGVDGDLGALCSVLNHAQGALDAVAGARLRGDLDACGHGSPIP